MSAWYIRREADEAAIARHLADPRSLRGWGLAGSCWECWAEVMGGPDAEDWDEAETVERFDLERAPALALGPDGSPMPEGVARCGHAGTPYAAYLPGLCALAVWNAEEAPDAAMANDLAASESYGWLPVVVAYEGREAGTDPDEGWDLFRPTGRYVLYTDKEEETR
jgi:hypothetical protein